MTWPTPITLQGDHATLVPLTMDHCADLIEATQDGELWKLWYARVPSPENMANEIQRRLDLQKKGEMLPFAVIDNQSQKAVGMTTYCAIDAKNKRLGIGWSWYRKSTQRTALNTECKLMLLQHAFEKLHCIAVEFRVHFFNHPSQKAVIRLGAKLDGLLRNLQIVNGAISDFYVYSIINTEWLQVKINLHSKLGLTTNETSIII